MTVGKYQLLDSGNFAKLEQVGDYRLVRPAAAAVWKPSLPESAWKSADATFERTTSEGGRWTFRRGRLSDCWSVAIGNVMMQVRLTEFGHIGMFPEHHASDLPDIAKVFHKVHGRPLRLLNLFAYTGALSLLAAKAGAEVVHVDASKTSVAWARDNVALSQLDHAPIRWMVEDVGKFVDRELRRGRTYDAIVLDPPSYGRGSKGQVWKIEQHLLSLMDRLALLASDQLSFVGLSCHTPGYTPIALANIVRDAFAQKRVPGMLEEAYEMSIAESGDGNRLLPSGACAVLRAPKIGEE